MVIEIDLSFLPGNFRSVIIHDVDREYQHQHKLNQRQVGYGDEKGIKPWIDNNRNFITLDTDYKSDLQKTERMIKDILIKRRIHDYVVIHDAEEEDKIVILKREHSEQLGVYHCRHCGMAFENQIQLSAHLRMHYFI